MKTIAAFSALIASSMAQGYFGVLSSRSASPIHLLSLTANGGKFTLGGTPSSYCPPQVGETCDAYPGNQTILAGGQGSLSLGVIVPGGQQVYVAPDGTLSYTSPHSTYKPEGSIVDGWNRTEGEYFGYITFASGLIACQTTEGKPWQVYGAIPAVNTTGCLGFSALTVNETDAGAWEY
ncbi:putative IgE-binding protein [Massarina eburnea CBS 473.64]|uniref:Putative IgE-binding protein n=1 Tax=Massarina eburnea CBS 473.64 TaxID=1395130 RepID=A0A6A6RZS0_9PLEO|nr:putative IgE-binding protein [Massarina eburnea CBS 473.64]